MKLPYGQKLLREIPVHLGEPLPSLPVLIFYAIRGDKVEAVIGLLTLQDEQGNTVYAYFV